MHMFGGHLGCWTNTNLVLKLVCSMTSSDRKPIGLPRIHYFMLTGGEFMMLPWAMLVAAILDFDPIEVLGDQFMVILVSQPFR